MLRSLAPAVRLFTRDRWVRLTFLAAIALGVAAGVAVLAWFPRGESVALHYNVRFGIDLVGEWYRLLRLPAVSLALAAVNAVVALFVWRRDRVLAYLLGAGTVVVAIVTTTATLLTIYLNR